MRDMTKGSSIKHIIAYAIPLLLANWFQMGYNAIDSMIVGRFIGKDALASVGIASPLMNFIILAITGLCIGAGVLMSEFYGAKNFKSLKLQFSTTMISGFTLSVIVAILGFLFIDVILKYLAVPNEIYQMTKTYVLITFLGAPFTFFYNALSAALKSVGDSKTPLKFLMIASILNGILDVIFIGGFHFGIVCSATTTVIAEALSAILSGVYVIKNIPDLWPEKWIINKEYLLKTIQYGGITALQQAIQPIGKLLIQGQVNALGVDVIAAFNAVTRVDDFAFTPEQSIASAITNFIAQNRGAKKEERIKNGFYSGMGLEVSYWLLVGTITWIFKEPIIELFVSENNVISIGTQYLSFMAFFYLWPALTNGVQGFFRGMGNLKMTVLGTFIQTSLRVIFTMILSKSLGITGIAYACVVGWSIMLIVEVPFCITYLRKLKNKN